MRSTTVCVMSATTASPRLRRRPPRALPRWLNLTGVGVLLALAVLWQLAVVSGVLDYDFLPSPTEVIGGFGDLVKSGEMQSAVTHTLMVTLVGWLLAAVVGIGLGLALGMVHTAWRYSMATIEILRALPAIAFVPAAVLVLGFSVRMELAIVLYVSQWPILISTITGVRNVTALHRDVARTLQFSTRRTVREIVLPSAAPYVVVGLQLALSLALALAIVAEMVGNPHGIGRGLVAAQQTLQSAQMYAYVVVVGLVGLGLNALFMGTVRWLFPGTTALIREQP
jgi:ABC-type nitrate/sulfonate/bicarbonate transport system permease component